MIIIDVINIFFEIIPQLILATSPVCVFAGMGSGSQSGKLTFKKIYSGEGIEITQNDTNLIFKTTGSGVIGINSCELLIGNFISGVTGSDAIKTLDTYNAITGVSVIGGTFSPTTYSLCNKNATSIIIGGKDNYNTPYSCYGTILGGRLNCITKTGPNFVCHGSIIGGNSNEISEGSGTILSSQKSKIFSGYLTNILISGDTNTICTNATVIYTAIIGGCDNQICGNRYSSIINSKNSCSSANFTTSINSIGGATVTKLQSPSMVDISGCGNVSQCNLSTQFTAISSSDNNNAKCSKGTSIISSCNNCSDRGTASSIISSIGVFLDYSKYGSIISSCSSKIIGNNVSNTSNFNSIISSEKSYIKGSCHSSILGSFGATISNSDSSTIISSHCGVIMCSNGSILSSISGAYKKSGIYNSTFSALFFRQCNFICSSVNSTLINGTIGEMTCTIDSGSIGVQYLTQKGQIPSYRNFILSFDKACIVADTFTSSDNFNSGCISGICDTFRSSIMSSVCSLILCSRDSSIVGSYCSCIVGSTNSVIIGSRFVSIECSRNSVIIAGWPGSYLYNCPQTTRTAHLDISGNVTMNGTNAVNFCAWSGSITTLTVCNGVITGIS